jgi:hypothetical protein
MASLIVQAVVLGMLQGRFTSFCITAVEVLVAMRRDMAWHRARGFLYSNSPCRARVRVVVPYGSGPVCVVPCTQRGFAK